MTGFGKILRVNKFLRRIGIGSKTIANMEPQFQEFQNSLNELTEFPIRYNQVFAADGWIAHDSLNFDILKQALNTFSSQGKEQALEVLLGFYGPEQMAERMFFFNSVEELQVVADSSILHW